MLKKRWSVIAFVLFFLPIFDAKAIDSMGPPASVLKQGQCDIGFVYSYSENDIKISRHEISETIKNVKINRYWANLGYGLADQWEVNLRLGATDAKADDLDFDGSTDFAWGWNTKLTFASAEKVDWGVLFQMSWLKTDESYHYDLSEYGLGTSQKIEFDAYEVQIAAGPTLKMEGWKLYGGPFLYLVKGGLDAKVGGVTHGFDLEEDSAFGVYAGTEIDLATNTSLNIEGQFTGDSWGIGSGILWKF
jgi:opacity protein-like surface antigen